MMRRRRLMAMQDEEEYFVPTLFTINGHSTDGGTMRLLYGRSASINYKLSYKNENDIKADFNLYIKYYDPSGVMISEVILAAINKNAVIRGRSSNILFGNGVYSGSEKEDYWQCGIYRIEAVAKDENGRYSKPLSYYVEVYDG